MAILKTKDSAKKSTETKKSTDSLESADSKASEDSNSKKNPKKKEGPVTGGKLKEGDLAPDFSLPDQEGKILSLTSLLKVKTVSKSGASNSVKKGGVRPALVLYFYPKDSTPGCTLEACSFRDSLADFTDLNIRVVGVSADSQNSHLRFSQNQNLSFPILSDVDHKVIESYGVWQEKSLYGRKFMGIVRSTFIINNDGTIAKIYPKVKVDGHHQEVLEFAKIALA